MDQFSVIIVEDVQLELRGTEALLQSQVPEANIIGTAQNEIEYVQLVRRAQPDLVLLDLGLHGSTTAGIELCRQTKQSYAPKAKVVVFTGETLNEKLWIEALDAGADGVILKTGEMLTRTEVMSVMSGKRYVFNTPALSIIIDRFRQAVTNNLTTQDTTNLYEIDEYDERFLRHLALGYTKDQISELRGIPFGVKSLEKRQADLIQRLFPDGSRGINATRLVTRAFELHILSIDNLEPDEE